MKALLGALLWMSACVASAQTTVDGDAWIAGAVMVGTNTAASSRLHVQASSATAVPFQVSGMDLSPSFRVGRDGKVGLSSYSAANLDVFGTGDNDNTSLELRAGNLYPAVSTLTQLSLGQNGTTDRSHRIYSVHLDSSARNSLDFKLWTPAAGAASDPAVMTVLSLVTISTASGASVHVRPFGEPTAELVVSNGAMMGGGTVHAATQVSPSSREWKSDISYLDASEEAAAYERIESLKHVSFRYARDKRGRFVRDRQAPLRRGLLYEEAPAVLRRTGSGLSFNERLNDTELAFKELARRLDALEKEKLP